MNLINYVGRNVASNAIFILTFGTSYHRDFPSDSLIKVGVYYSDAVQAMNFAIELFFCV